MENEEYKIMHILEQTHWWFAGKQFLVEEILSRFASMNMSSQKRKVLDVGCGTGIILKVLEKFGTPYGVELSPQAIEFLKKRDLERIACADANQSIPFKSGTFTIITCLDVLEHLDNDLGLMEEMLRVCKPGGYIFVTVPAFGALWSGHDVALHHKRRYARNKLLEVIGNLRCTVEKASYYNTVLFPLILIIRKSRSLFMPKEDVQSDLFIPVPALLNWALKLLFKAEIRCLRFMSFPFGVSIMLLLKKLGRHQPMKR
ncbi:MAG: class I SAM-dependent methyltransferase [Deltaproteobacteria bacterium]|nr:class I SAM-dependent methyltransferase [Deltaproteobacteria bacterium]